METKKIDTKSISDVNRWVDLPFRIYKDHPYWVPLLKNGVRKLLNKNLHPYYLHSDADFFVVEEQGEVLARVCVMENTRYNQHHGEKSAFFGYFDSVENIDAARMIFARVFEWASARGLDTVYGPKGLLGAAAGGALVEGFDLRAAIDIPYNYPYYDEYIKDAGFVKYRDILSGFIHREEETDIPERVINIAKRMAERGGFYASRFKSKAELRQIVNSIGDLHRKAFVEIPGYYPLTDEEFAWMADELISIADPELITLVMKDEQVVGFVFAYPDISGGLQKANGSLLPFGWWHILRAQKTTDWVILNGVGILPEYQGRGANAIMYVELARTLLQSRFNHGDLVQVGEENYRSMQDQLTFGVKWTKKHRVYIREP